MNDDARFQYFYDYSGNLIQKINKTSGQLVKYDHNSENQLISVAYYVSALSTTPIKGAYYSYDPSGRRIRKQVYDFGSLSDNKKNYIRNYGYDGAEIALEISANGDLLARYTHSTLNTDDVLSVDVTSLGASEGLAQSAGSYQFIKDYIGSVRAIANSNGLIVQRVHYSVFGEILSLTNGDNSTDISNAPVLRTHFSFTGREWDEESGLYYYRARYYDPSVGRFIQQDPHPGSVDSPITFINKYIYTANAPTLYRDPTGKFFGFDELFLMMFIGAIVGAVDVSLHTGNFVDILSGGVLGAVVGAGLMLTAYFAPASDFFGILGAPSKALGVLYALAPAAYSAGSKGGSFVHNFELNVAHGDTVIAAGLGWMGDMGRSILGPGLSSPDWIEKGATTVLYTYTYLLEYGLGINQYCNGSGERKCK